MTAYIMCKHAISKAKKRYLDMEMICYWSGYIAGIRDRGELTNLQVRKLDNLITAE